MNQMVYLDLFMEDTSVTFKYFIYLQQLYLRFYIHIKVRNYTASEKNTSGF